MKNIIRKAYIQPSLNHMELNSPIMQVNPSLPQGNGDDPVIDNPDDELSKGRKDGWGDLW